VVIFEPNEEHSILNDEVWVVEVVLVPFKDNEDYNRE
jgi:hypothetical protein